MALSGDDSTGETYGALMQRHVMSDAEASAAGIRRRWTSPTATDLRAQFARVAVDADLGIIRVRHLVGAFAPGRV